MAQLVEASDLKTILGISDTVDDARLEAVALAAQEMVQAYCGRQFIADDVASARVYYADTFRFVEIDDIACPEGIVIKTDEDDDGIFETTWADSDYDLWPLNRKLSGQTWPWTRVQAVAARDFPWGKRPTVEVTARWGWPIQNCGESGNTQQGVPDAVYQAAQIQGVSIFKSADAPLGIAGFGDIGIMRLRQAMHPVAMALLAPYRKDPVLVA